MARPKATKASQSRETIKSRPVDPTSLTDVLRRAIVDYKEGTASVIARDAGVSVDAVQRFLDGERGLTLETSDKIARAMGYRLVPVEPSE